MAKEINANLVELKPQKEIKSKNLTKYFWEGKQVFFNEKPEIMKSFSLAPPYGHLHILLP